MGDFILGIIAFIVVSWIVCWLYGQAAQYFAREYSFNLTPGTIICFLSIAAVALPVFFDDRYARNSNDVIKIAALITISATTIYNIIKTNLFAGIGASAVQVAMSAFVIGLLIFWILTLFFGGVLGGGRPRQWWE